MKSKPVELLSLNEGDVFFTGACYGVCTVFEVIAIERIGNTLTLLGVKDVIDGTYIRCTEENINDIQSQFIYLLIK